jgi:hypothetical protein
MEATETQKKISTREYDAFITETLGLDKVYFAKFSDYQGIWLLVAKDVDNYYIYKDYFGSCSGCDELEGEFDKGEVELSKAQAFVEKHYHPFLTISKGQMAEIVKSGNLELLFPKNVRTYDDKIDYADVESDIMLSLAMDQGLVTGDLILKAKNQEIKQKALKQLGYEEFVKQVHSTIIHTDGPDELIEIVSGIPKTDPIKFLHVKDVSTERMYLLRVPPTIQRVKQGKAWTFGMGEEEYLPIKET